MPFSCYNDANKNTLCTTKVVALYNYQKFQQLDMHPLAVASRSRLLLLCSKRPIMRSALNVSLRKTRMSDIALNQSINQFICRHIYLNKGDISRLQTNLKLTVLSNTKLRHF